MLTVLACSGPDDVPSNVLPVKNMVPVVWDVLMADEYAILAHTKDSSIDVKKETLRLYTKVFKKHDISSETFGKSYQFYKTNPDMEKTLLDSLQVFGNKTRESYNIKVPFELPALRL